MIHGRALIVVLAAASMATAPLLTKELLGAMGVAQLSVLRAVIGGAAVALVTLITGAGLPTRRQTWVSSVVGGACMVAIPFGALAVGQRAIPSAMGGLLYGLTPVFVMLGAAAVRQADRPRGAQVAGVWLALVGVTVTVAPNLLQADLSVGTGQLVTLCGPLAYAIGSLVLRGRPPEDGLMLASGMYICASAILGALCLTVESPAISWTARTRLLAVLLATLGSALLTVLGYIAVRDLGATQAALVMYLFPLFALLYGVAIAGETFRLHEAVGAAAIIAGCLMMLRRQAIAKGS